MTIVEKAAYLKGLTEGLGITPDSKEGKLWGALNELLSDMAHEIEDLQASNLDFAEALDDISEDLTYLEELTCDLDMPEDMLDEDDCDGDRSSCRFDCGVFDEDGGDDEEDDDEDEELSYDGVMYEVTCPVCGEEVSFDEDTLSEGSIACPGCGETLEFDLDSEND